MSEQDEVAIAEAILESIRSDEPMAPWVAGWGSLDSQPIDGDVNLIRAARAILARWRLVPVGSVYTEPDASTVDCSGCGRYAGQPCYRIEHRSGGDGYTRRDIPVDMPIGSYHLVRQNAANQHAAQHRAADELTQHDIDTGIYGTGTHKHYYVDVSTFADADAGRHHWLCECGATSESRDRA